VVLLAACLVPAASAQAKDRTYPVRSLGYTLGDSAFTVAGFHVEESESSPLAPIELTGNVHYPATGSGPFQLAAGRANTAQAALPLNMLAAPLGSRKVQDLPEATLGMATVASMAEPGPLTRALPAGVSDKAALLWAVLIAGVLLLGGVAWSLLRQLKSPPAAAD
jgi:hypothetical protein